MKRPGKTRTRKPAIWKALRLTGKKRHRLAGWELRFIKRTFDAEMRVRKAIAESHAEVIEERGVKYSEQPPEIKGIVNEIYWAKYRRFHRMLDEIVGTAVMAAGAIAEMEPLMHTGTEIAQGHLGHLPGSPSRPLKNSRKRLRAAIAASGDERISRLRQKYPSVGVDVNGNMIFRPGKMSERVEEFIMRHLNIREKSRHKRK